MPTLSIVIVNFNSDTYLVRLRKSIETQIFKDFEVIIIDNNSIDGSKFYLMNWPEIITLFNLENRGFAAAQNQGFALAKGEFILALNFDLLLPPDFFGNLLEALMSNLEAGWACGKLLNLTPDGSQTNIFYAAGHILPDSREPLLRGNGNVDIGQYDKKEYVFGAPGAAALYRRKMVEDIQINGQFFDESFFTWCEDVDVDWRGQNHGWKCLYVPNAVAYHQGHVNEKYTEPFRSFRAMLTIRNRWLMMIANEKKYEKIFSIPIIKYEFGLMIYVLRVGLFMAYLKAIYSCIKLLPITIQKHRNIFKT